MCQRREKREFKELAGESATIFDPELRSGDLWAEEIPP